MVSMVNVCRLYSIDSMAQQYRHKNTSVSFAYCSVKSCLLQLLVQISLLHLLGNLFKRISDRISSNGIRRLSNLFTICQKISIAIHQGTCFPCSNFIPQLSQTAKLHQHQAKQPTVYRLSKKFDSHLKSQSHRELHRVA
jgi:hypothetical protein